MRKKAGKPRGRSAPPAKKGREAKKATRKPRQARLEGMDDPEIEDIEALAEQYAEKTAARQALLKEEVSLKSDLKDAMKRNGKTVYRHAGIVVTVTPESEKVRVKINRTEREAAKEGSAGATAA